MFILSLIVGQLYAQTTLGPIRAQTCEMWWYEFDVGGSVCTRVSRNQNLTRYEEFISTIDELNARIQALENRLSSLEEKLQNSPR